MFEDVCITEVNFFQGPSYFINFKYRFLYIGVGRFRILGGGGQGGGGGKGGPNSQQAHDVVMTSMRRNNVASTSFRRHVPTRLKIFIVLPVPTNQIKVAFNIILPFNLVHL